MKRRLLIGMLVLLAALPLTGQTRTVERVYVSTDKDVFVAGDRVWCSVFCMTPEGKLSSISSLAYLELHGPDFMAANARIALEGGRGAGYVDLPVSLPTGNYRLIAYTAQNKAEQGYDYEGLASKTLSVFNVLTTERLPDGVDVVDDEAYDAMRSRVKPGMDDVMPGTDPASLELRWENGRLQIVNQTGENLSLSLSVFHDDGIVSNDNPGIGDFLPLVRKIGPKTFDNRFPADFEGEIIRGRVAGYHPDMEADLAGKYAFIASPSDKSDLYAAPIQEDGSLTFYTAGIFGDKECICEIEGVDPKLSCHVELASPYVNAAVAPAAPLPMSPSLRQPLEARSVAMQLQRRFEADTLQDFLLHRTDGLFDENVVIRYILDDYTRFTTMEEVLVEIVTELKIRRGDDGARTIQVNLQDAPTAPVFSSGQTLMLLDGVPVFDQQKILDYDPLLVAFIDIYPLTHFIGNRVFEGVANFVTYKHNLPSFKFDENARVVDYQGVCLPMAATGSLLAGERDYPDYRQTIYWHPLLEVGAGENPAVECKLPLYKGRFTAVAEGLTASGEAVSWRISFEVR